MVEYGKITQEIINILKEIVGDDNVSLDPEVIEKHAIDESLEPPHPTEVVVSPSNTHEISEIMKLAYSKRIPITPQGSRTGLSQFYPKKDWQLNLQSVRTILKLARREGVNVAIENTPEPFPSLMKRVDDFHRFFNDLEDDLGMVLDVAHANLNNQIQDFLKQFSKKIVHMHVSDNNGDSDLHLGIGHGNIDWKNVAKAVKDSGYGNLIMIESTDHIQESLQTLRDLFS